MARNYRRWDFASVMQAASNYRSRSDFKYGQRGAYEAARRAGILDSLFPIVRGWDVAEIKPICVKKVLQKPKMSDDDLAWLRQEVEEYIDNPLELAKMREWFLREKGWHWVEVADALIEKMNRGSSNNP